MKIFLIQTVSTVMPKNINKAKKTGTNFDRTTDS